MIILLILLFIIGYVAIAMEHPLKVNKAATAMLLAVLMWTVYILSAPSFSWNQGMDIDALVKQIVDVQIIWHIGEISEILFFLLGAMTIVELVDVHGGFSIITDRITTKNKRKLLWIVAFITFFLSAILDNLTTAIVMTMLLRKLVKERDERLIFAGIVILAANSGGAFSPIGDVTTIMLWIGGQVTSGMIITELFFPSLISLIIPLLFATSFIKGVTEVETASNDCTTHVHHATKIISPREKNIIFALGLSSLIFVPLFKAITHLPPFIGVFFGLSILWIYTELMYHRKGDVDEKMKARISQILSRIDVTTILFFLGILMAVAVLQETRILSDFGRFLEDKVENMYIINIIIGILSAVVDNVPLVAGAMKMYPVIPGDIMFAVDGNFWIFLAYCAGVGGSILVIGSAAGVVVMGLEKMNFMWYMKKFSLITLIGYLAGAAWYIIEMNYIAPMIH